MALFTKSRTWSVMVYLACAIIGLGVWGEIIHVLRQQPEAPSTW